MTQSYNITRLDTPRCKGGEQPLWDEAEQALYFIDNSGKTIHRYDPGTMQTRSWELPSVITSLALCKSGGALVTLRTGIYLFHFDSGDLRPIHPLEEPSQFVYNDAKVDRRGRWIIGASTTNFEKPTPSGGLYSLDTAFQLRKLDDGIHFSNGPCFSPEDSVLYFSDSWLKTCYAYDYDIESGNVSNRRPFADTSTLGGLPDGATVDRDGRVWIAVYGAGKVVAYRPDGQIDRIIELPVNLVSSVMFFGIDLDRLCVTTIMHGMMGESVEEGAGYLYVIDGLDVHGVPEPRFGG